MNTQFKILIDKLQETMRYIRDYFPNITINPYKIIPIKLSSTQKIRSNLRGMDLTMNSLY